MQSIESAPSSDSNNAGDKSVAANAALKKQRNKPKTRKNQPTVVKNQKPAEIGTGPHKLETPWTFWYCKIQPKISFESSLVKLGTCTTIEEFWSLYSHIQKPFDMAPQSSLHLFRGDSVPMWENYQNGGVWAIHLKRRSTLLSRLWEELLFAAVGEIFEEPDVVGVVVGTRPREDVLYLWNKDSSLKYKIGERLKAILHLPQNCPMEYRANRSSIEQKTTGSQEEEDHSTPTTTTTTTTSSSEQATESGKVESASATAADATKTT
eukprot:TRINITY_DN296_c7_g1_i1.p1 TRINITY_DN296_c7_g1~~TRINITY_DN296_c7_g1_i1.p1  ORF type:complete len:265 (+),score=62.25 TRINITY_DN296_c7_g1_i1:45-839(+)